jgi:hypothetical protein
MVYKRWNGFNGNWVVIFGISITYNEMTSNSWNFGQWFLNGGITLIAIVYLLISIAAYKGMI